MKKVSEVMTKDCITVTPQDNVYEVAVLMAKNEIGFIPVVDEQDKTKLIGVVTDRDIVRRCVAAKKPGSTAVSEVMSEQLITVSSEELADEATDLMAHHQVRRLPVVDQGKLVGVIALGDMALKNTSNASHALHDISKNEQSSQYLQ